MAEIVTFRVLASASGGRLSVVEVLVPPGGGPPPLHTHPPDEIFTVVEGVITVFAGDPLRPDRRELATGDVTYVSGGVPHTFRNFDDSPARLVLTFAPGELMEQFFARIGIPVADPQNPPPVDLDAEVRRIFSTGAALGIEQLDSAYA
jgi:quercetin dioxygenase-like cupin family protein